MSFNGSRPYAGKCSYLSNAAAETELAECARMAKVERRIEDCIQRVKREGDLADQEVDNWKGWHHRT